MSYRPSLMLGRRYLGSWNEGCIKGTGVVRKGGRGGGDYRRDGVKTRHVYHSFPSSCTCRQPMKTRRSSKLSSSR